FDAPYFNLAPRECNAMDPQQRLLLEVAVDALDDAGMTQDEIKGTNTGVYIGTFNNDYEMLSYFKSEIIDLYSIVGGGRYSLPNRISYFFDLRGPSIQIDTACSSTATAFHQACEFLKKGVGKAALVGGCNLLINPYLNIGLSYSGVLSPTGKCQFGDSKGDGYIRGEAVGIFILKRLNDAIQDNNKIYALVRGTGLNADGASSNLLIQPGDATQAELMQSVWMEAGITANDIDYIEAHGTGTKAGDPIEMKAFQQALQTRNNLNTCYIGSVKTNIGHSEGASAFASILKIIMSLKNKRIPPSLHFTQPHTSIEWEKIPVCINNDIAEWPQNNRPGIAVMNSFGMTGANAHLVFEEYIDNRKSIGLPRIEPHILPISAKSEISLIAYLEKYKQFLHEESFNLNDICYSASNKRNHYLYRVALTGFDKKCLVQEIEKVLTNSTITANSNPKIAFVYSGQGSAWPQMAKELLENNQIFSEAIDEIDRQLINLADISVREHIIAPISQSKFDNTQIAQFCIFAIQVALTKVLNHFGIYAQGIVGHSVGEITAAYIANAITLNDALTIIFYRSQFMQHESIRGKMLSINLSMDACQQLLNSQQFHTLSIAVINSPDIVVVSGSESEINHLMDLCKQKEIYARLLNVEFAFHSKFLSPFKQKLAEKLAISISPAKKINDGFYSTVLGKKIVNEQFDSNYWANNMCQPVLFASAIENLLNDEYNCIVEISPHTILTESILTTAKKLGNVKINVVPTLRKTQSSIKCIYDTLGKLYEAGCTLNWTLLYPSGQTISLPTYPFQKNRYWI
ncbi:MAG: type I polyketide synthase, partial [Gammaproteobacteria bacterium]